MPETTPPVLAALFDMDGVLINNTDFHINAWLQFAQKHDRPLTRDQYVENINGRVSADAMAYVFQRPITPGELIVLTEEKESIYRELYRPHLQPALGLLDFMNALQAEGIRLAVGTSAPESNVLFTLDGLPLRPYFDAVVDASMIKRGKPDPEIYLTAADRVGATPAHSIVFEDAFSGIESGLRAGMKVIAIATTHSRDELADTGALLIVDDFTELTADAIRALIA
ncbi:HAD family hydrolase [Spirosoma fluviale]|uniref:Haloacid dehalogenase superfamily, subfamily IA, variant 3 with third motif having DD or ED n=1 Tax=Spirosoma fluviale TaxID=1597977 RepID=A0A286F7P1_9BACT|nr:HAD family phosphatase [Spirosoma fluviale]SOD79019.1 haloacid dehalogenase superfamily, subfamily IA, variant 3 with third motif having DD or ED [Spirosoma fluviale]